MEIKLKPTYEYMHLQLGNRDSLQPLVDIINEYAREGWHVIAFMQTHPDNSVIDVVLEREL